MSKTDFELANDLWEEVQYENIIPLKRDAYFNKDSSTLMLLEDLVMVNVFQGNYFLSFSYEMQSAIIITDIYDWVSLKTGKKPVVVDSFYIYFEENTNQPSLLMGEEAERFYLKDRCFSLFKELLQTKNMGDFLENLDVEEMSKC